MTRGFVLTISKEDNCHHQSHQKKEIVRSESLLLSIAV
jgi:hypothetical protein